MTYETAMYGTREGNGQASSEFDDIPECYQCGDIVDVYLDEDIFTINRHIYCFSCADRHYEMYHKTLDL